MALIIGTNFDGPGTPVTLALGDNFLLQQGVLIRSTNGRAIDAFNSNHSLSIYGAIIGGNSGVQIGGGATNDIGNRLFIGASGSISATAFQAVVCAGGQAEITNQGVVAGSQGIAMYSNTGAGSKISNAGAVIAESQAIQVVGDEGLLVANTGRIESYDDEAIYVYSVSSAAVSISNAGLITGLGMAIRHEGAGLMSISNTGTITSRGNTGVQTSEGAITLVNSGTIKGSSSFSGDAGVDKVTNKGTMIGAINLAANNDLYEGNGGRVFGTIGGAGGTDQLRGGAFADVMNGGAGGDLILGRGGRDDLRGDDAPFTLNNVLYSFPANDIFDYDAITDSGPTAATRDLIRDFNFGNDRIDLSTIDANTSVAGSQAFGLLAKGTDSSAVAPGKIGWYWIDSTVNANDRTIIRINNDTDATIEMTIELVGLKSLSATAGVDFIF